MLGPMGAHIISALRVMTPSEIDRYAKTSEKKKVTALASGGETFDLEDSQTGAEAKAQTSQQHKRDGFKPLSEAEIIPLRPKQEKSSASGNEGIQERCEPPRSAEDTSRASGSRSESNGELESLGIFSADKINEVKMAREAAAKAKEDSSSIFLLKQRQRLKRTNVKMAGNAALKTYNDTLSAEILHVEPDVDNPDEEPAQGSKGILINKKHF